MQALDFALAPVREIVVVGKPEAENTARLLREINQRFLPSKVLLFRSVTDKNEEILRLAPFLKNHKLVDERAAVYVCENQTCQQPVTDPKKLGDILGKQ